MIKNVYLFGELSNYGVHDNGTVINSKGKIMVPYEINSGYLALRLSHKNTRTHKLVHRLVWEAFNGAIPENMYINHIDGNKHNNALSNLELVTRSENMIHASRTGLSKTGEDHYKSIYTNEQVRHCCELIATGKYKRSKIAKMTGVEGSLISGIISRTKWYNISKDYDFSKYYDLVMKKGPVFDEFQKDVITLMIIDGHTDDDIMYNMALCDNKDIRKALYRIRYKVYVQRLSHWT